MKIMNFKYTVFETKLGYFGLLGTKNTLFKAILPRKTLIEAKKNLLVGINDGNVISYPSYFLRLQGQIAGYFNGKYKGFFTVSGVELCQLSDFACSVLCECKRIPFGETMSYSALAEACGHSKAARAVGRVLAGNPLPLIIPCHRVICSDGSIGGFMGNSPGAVELKTKMLRLENG